MRTGRLVRPLRPRGRAGCEQRHGRAPEHGVSWPGSTRLAAQPAGRDPDAPGASARDRAAAAGGPKARRADATAHLCAGSANGR